MRFSCETRPLTGEGSKGSTVLGIKGSRVGRFKSSRVQGTRVQEFKGSRDKGSRVQGFKSERG
jgi:hypothetical protein